MRVQVAEQHHARRRKPLPDIAVPSRHLIEYATRGCQGLARNRKEILEPDWNPAEEWCWTVTVNRILSETRVGPRRSRPRIIRINVYPGVDRFRVTVEALIAVAVVNAGGARLDEFKGGELSCGEQGCRLDHSQVGWSAR